MERHPSGLLAFHVSQVAAVPSVEPVGAYDPTQQLWVGDGTVAASCTLAPPCHLDTECPEGCRCIPLLNACFGL
ncbi:MAG: hypothetical protein JO202_17775 [Ktedonobacteraceae bacterium]|nr:hypothetical protein [Ktedonobacteraceae bacterium]